ncbi:hypothetical protein DFR74_12537 [Nocardia puris]|uniref:Uncharacterized protein n=1 Tax=Nocardia puris TaxID=208602 RepID=A0A366CW67_9NOCA|nr:hypothetical protein DFR74_12537 [Nocardia puris]
MDLLVFVAGLLRCQAPARTLEWRYDTPIGVWTW